MEMPNVFRNIDDVPEWTRTFRDSPNQIAPSKFVGKKGQKIFDNAKNDYSNSFN